MELMTMQFPLSREIMTTVRLVTGGVCALLGFDLDSAEDCKVCVTESLLLLRHGGCTRAKVAFFKEEELRVLLEGEGTGEREEKAEEEISIALLNALVERLEMKKEENVTRISFGFRAS